MTGNDSKIDQKMIAVGLQAIERKKNWNHPVYTFILGVHLELPGIINQKSQNIFIQSDTSFEIDTLEEPITWY